MKIYIIPIEKRCNGRCSYCITRSRKPIDSDFLDQNQLMPVLDKFGNIKSIEITGGGEPLLNPEIGKIVKICSKKAKTKLYTNGELLSKNYFITEDLDEICISRMHYKDDVNEKLMGVQYGLKDVIKNIRCDLKLSLLLNQQGIDSSKELLNYIKWAESLGIGKIVVRELSLQDSFFYYQSFEKQFVQIRQVLRDMDENLEQVHDKDDNNQFYRYQGTTIEFEKGGCNSSNSNLIIRSDGNLYHDWDFNERLTQKNFIIRYLKKISTTSSCLGLHVSALIMKDDQVLGVGSNSGSPCSRVKFCNRVIKKKEKDYSACLCTHAEISAINDCDEKSRLKGSIIYIYGHYKTCPDCLDVLKDYGVNKAILVSVGKEMIL